MARSVRSISRSPSLGSFCGGSSSSSESAEESYSQPGSRAASPEAQADSGRLPGEVTGTGGPEDDTVTCLWENCGRVYNHLPTLIEHIHNDHIGVHKSNYTCEWATCNRRGLAQTSRFALISHIRSHTGEKPFICPRPECDKSFTRSDALAKHMRLQHNISPPLPGRGGNRKRKRDEDEDDDLSPLEGGGGTDYFNYGHGSTSTTFAVEDEDVEDASDSDDEGMGLPEQLLEAVDPKTGLVHGRSVAMTRYLVMKAKMTYAMEVHRAMIEDLRAARAAEHIARMEKEEVLNDVLRIAFGPHADPLMVAIDLPRYPPDPAQTAQYGALPGPAIPPHISPGAPTHLGPGTPTHPGPGTPTRMGPGTPSHMGPGTPSRMGPGTPSHAGPGTPGHIGPGSPPMRPRSEEAALRAREERMVVEVNGD